MRTANAADAAEAVVTKLNDRVDPACVWDALFLTAGELLMKQPGIVGLHTVTTVNALAFGYQTTATTRRAGCLMLQAASFLTMFRAAHGQPPGQPAHRHAGAGRADGPGPGGDRRHLRDALSTDKLAAARKTLALVAKSARSAARHDGDGPPAHLRQGDRFARLQIQLGRPWKISITSARPGATAISPPASFGSKAPQATIPRSCSAPGRHLGTGRNPGFRFSVRGALCER